MGNYKRGEEKANGIGMRFGRETEVIECFEG